MRVLRQIVVVLIIFSGLAGRGAAREFEVAVYNVENLFDVDGVALFDDYKPPNYTTEHLANKLAGISRVVQRMGGGKGPDVILFIELEADRTPRSSVTDLPAFLKKWSSRKNRDLLDPKRPLDSKLKGVPAFAWLAKQLQDDGISGYEVAVGQWRPDDSGRTIAHVNAVFSRFPIKRNATLETDGARGILEVEIDVDGRPLIVFANHWKSGASDPESEPIRIGNARAMKARLDQILRDDPSADIVVGGDFNSQYNQKQRYPRMRRTAINDTLGSQGDETAMVKKNAPPLYNLWFELPNEQRGSDVFRDEWGTLIQMLITRGLYDQNGVQYVDNSFAVGAFPGLNVEKGTGRPVRWEFDHGGVGFSDHLPVLARFRTVDGKATERWITLDRPSRSAEGPAEAVAVGVSESAIIDLAQWPARKPLLDDGQIGNFFRVKGVVSRTRPFEVNLDGFSLEVPVWIHNRDARESVFQRYREGDRIEFVGELGQYRGDWQFVIPENLVSRAR